MALFSTAHALSTDIDISTSAFWAKSFEEREESFAQLRSEAPVSWHRPLDWHEPHQQEGFWAVTRAEDIATVSLSPDVYRSGHGTMLEPLAPELSTPASFFLTMDGEQHSRYRRLISAAFTPKAIGRIAEQIRRNAEAIVDSLIGAGTIDFVADCSSRLPMTTVSDIVGVPESQRAAVSLAAERLVGGADIRTSGYTMDEIYQKLAEEMFFLFGIGAELAAHRRTHPGDDLMTGLVQAEVDGHRLSDDDIGAFLVMISVAGNDTTKQTTSLGMLGLAQSPDQREWLMEDFDGRIAGATEELVRWVSPIQVFSRTAAEDAELAGQRICAGDKVGLFYCSGNRDESLFSDPMRLDLSRTRNPHQGFGGGGPHFCLGNGVAKTQIRAIYQQLLTRIPNIEFGEPEQLQSHFVRGVTRLPATIH
jgi:cytochrome P450